VSLTWHRKRLKSLSVCHVILIAGRAYNLGAHPYVAMLPFVRNDSFGRNVMDLYLLRHAEAGEAPRDDDRELTEHGHKQARAVASGLAALAPRLDALLCSPLPRAIQTANPAATALRLSIEQVEALASGRAAGDVLDDLAGRGSSNRVLLVGHEPQLSQLALHLTGGRVHMRKAMLARITVLTLDPPYGDLEWLLSWRHLERIGK